MPSSTTTEAATATELAVDDITILSNLQPRGGLRKDQVKRYKEAMVNGDVFDPILLGRYRGKLLLLDGFHRVEARRLGGFPTVQAIIHRVATLAEAGWLAFEANFLNGLALPPGRKRDCFKNYIRAKRHLGPDGQLRSYRDMANDFHGYISYGSLRNYMIVMHPEIAAKIGAEHGPGGNESPTDFPGDNGWPAIGTPAAAVAQAVRDAVELSLPEGALVAPREALSTSERYAVIATLSQILATLKGKADREHEHS